MNLKRASIVIFSLLCVLSSVPAPCERTMYLNLCQEIVNSARSYEARATFHARVAKNVQMQIETMSRLPKDQAQSTAIDNLFTQYQTKTACWKPNIANCIARRPTKPSNV